MASKQPDIATAQPQEPKDDSHHHHHHHNHHNHHQASSFSSPTLTSASLPPPLPPTSSSPSSPTITKSNAPPSSSPLASSTASLRRSSISADQACENRHDKMSPTMALSSSKVAGQSIAPFLVKHIPDQYAPLGTEHTEIDNVDGENNTKFCYRHRPDLKCRRSADEIEMEELQRNLESLPRADQQGIAHVWSLFSAAPAKHRTLMLQGILTQCCFPQLSYLSNAVRDLIRIDFISALPAEVAFKILCYLDTNSLCKAAQVSQRWRAMADDDVVWHKMCEQHIERKCTKCGLGLPLLERKRLRDWKRQQQLRASGRGINKWSPELTPTPADISNIPLTFDLSVGSKRSAGEIEGANSQDYSKRLCTDGVSGQSSDSSDAALEKRKFRPWKDVYKDRFKVTTNWRHGRCVVRVFRGHTNGVMCLQFVDSMLATGSYDSTIKIWDTDTGEEVRTLRGHTSGIRALQFDETKLISGSLDKTIKVWNWRTGECLATLDGHQEGIVGLHFQGNLLASGSIDKTVKIWNFQDKSTFSLRGHKDWVNAVRLDTASRTVFSASDDCTIRLWDLDNKKCLRIYEGHVGQVQQVVLMPNEFEPELLSSDNEPSSTEDGTSPASVSEYGDVPVTEMYGEEFQDGRPLPPRYMLTSALDSTVRLWDVASGQCLKTLFGHVEGVWALAADTLRIVSGAEDRMVKVWDARTGKNERTFTGHAGPVTCIGLSDSRMCTGSEDHLVRMYSFRAEEFENENGEPRAGVESTSSVSGGGSVATGSAAASVPSAGSVGGED